MRLCSDMDITIHGQTYPHPDFCEEQVSVISLLIKIFTVLSLPK